MKPLTRLLTVVLSLWFVAVTASAGLALAAKRRRTSIGDEESNEFELVSIMEGLDFKSRAAAFRRGSWLAYFGGGELDLSDARLDPQGSHLDLRAIFGGGEITVPGDCKVEVRTRGIGGVDDSTGFPTAAYGRTLTI